MGLHHLDPSILSLRSRQPTGIDSAIESSFWCCVHIYCTLSPNTPLLTGLKRRFHQVANLYYSHPLLDLLAQEFNVSQERAAIIPTAAQAGYAGGILFLCPMGDLVRRRPFVLSLMLFTATVSLGVCITKRYEVFVAVTFLMSVTTVTPVCSPIPHELRGKY